MTEPTDTTQKQDADSILTESGEGVTTIGDNSNTDSENPRSGESGEAVADEDAETFPRSYVERLRRENAGYRERAQVGDAYAQRLHTELVKATGRLADPTDLPFDPEHLDHPEKLADAVNALLERKPHLASRRPAGDIGQGVMSGGAANVDLAAILRQRAQ